MIPRPIGNALKAVLRMLDRNGKVRTGEIAVLLAITRHRAANRIQRWVSAGWLVRTGPAEFGAGCKALGRREEPPELSNEWMILKHAQRCTSVVFKDAMRIIGDDRGHETTRALANLVGARWLLPSGDGDVYPLRPDPFMSDETRERLADVIEKLRSGELIMKRKTDA